MNHNHKTSKWFVYNGLRSTTVRFCLALFLAGFVYAPAAKCTAFAYGLFIEGGIGPGAPYFGAGQNYDALFIANYSTAGELITQVQIDLSTAAANLYLDTSAAPPGSGSGIFWPVTSLFEVGTPGLTLITGATDGSTFLVFDFNSFGPGMAIAFAWDVDGGTVPFPPGPGEVVSEADFTGVRMTVLFDNGVTGSAIFQPRSEDDPIFSAEARVLTPEPTSLSLSLFGLAAAFWFKRRSSRRS